MGDSSNGKLWLRILAANLPHVGAAPFRRQFVQGGRPSLPFESFTDQPFQAAEVLKGSVFL